LWYKEHSLAWHPMSIRGPALGHLGQKDGVLKKRTKQRSTVSDWWWHLFF